MRILLMIGNNNIAVRELYGLVLRERFPGWGTSNMSALPGNAAAIVQAYDALVYEIGKPDDPARYRAALGLWEEIKPLRTVQLITHVEGPFRDGIAAELEEQGVIVVGSPFIPDAITAAFERVAPRPRGKEQAGPQEDRSGRGLLRRLFRRRRE